MHKLSSSKSLHRLLKLPALLAILSGLAACGTGFVEGWHDKPSDTVDPAVVEAHCKAKPDHVWKDGTCVKVSGAELNEDQCKDQQGYVWHVNECIPQAEFDCLQDPASSWVSNRCVARPTLKFKDPSQAKQTITAGAAIAPIAFDVSPGSHLVITAQSCANLLRVSGSQLVSEAGYKLPADANDRSLCQAEVMAAIGAAGRETKEAASAPLAIEITLTKGFLDFCNSFDKLSAAAQRTVRVLTDRVGNPRCEDAAKKLAEQETLNLMQGCNADGKDCMTDLAPLRGLSKLKTLDLSYNHIKDLTPLADLPGLTSLKLSSNSIVDLTPLAKLTALSYLDLSGNQILDVSPLANLKSLSTTLSLNLEDNPLGTTAKKTEKNCPTGSEVAAAVRGFCHRTP